jgi:hypothetical protein
MLVLKHKEFGESATIKLEDYVLDALEREDYYTGALEAASAAATNCGAALGRLCEVLVEKNILTLDDVVYIANSYDKEKLEKVEN